MSTSSRQRGGVLLVMVVLLAGVLLAAVVVGVLFARQLNQQRALETQRRLETAFRGLFPFQQRVGMAKANMWSDFGYRPTSPGAPPANAYDLRGMTSMSAVRLSDAANDSTLPTPTLTQFTGTVVASHLGNIGAWNGPYWQGPVDSQGRPLDAWGRPIQLRWISTSTPAGWQVFSPGANGVSETGNAATPSGDDQVHPRLPYVPPTITPPSPVCSSPTFTFRDVSRGNPAETVTFTLTTSLGTQVVSAIFNNGHPYGTGWTPATKFTNVPQGTYTIYFTGTKTGNGQFNVTVNSACQMVDAATGVPGVISF